MTSPGRVVVLVHAPLVGPSSWKWVAEELHGQGHRVVVPNLHASGEASHAQFVTTIVEAIPPHSPVVLVGHSGGGMLLPFAAAAAAVQDVAYVFVDSGLPPLNGVPPVGPSSSSLEERVDADGLLRPWHTWWGDDGMRQMVPDAGRRRVVCSDVPRLPVDYFDTSRQVPHNWASAPGGYVLLSDLYRLWAQTAASYGWPVEEVLGSHLELVNQPARLAQAILRVAPPTAS